MKELKETIPMMASEDYKERFKAEYWQAKIRMDKLNELIFKIETDQLGFKPKCPFATLKIQWAVMKQYVDILKKRAAIEGVELDEQVHD